jgi:hypothetical protein
MGKFTEQFTSSKRMWFWQLMLGVEGEKKKLVYSGVKAIFARSTFSHGLYTLLGLNLRTISFSLELFE